MKTQQISRQQFIDKLQPIVNLPIWRVIHPADGWLFVDLGEKYLDSIVGLKGENKPYLKGQCQLYIRGEWSLIHKGNIINSKKVQPNESQSLYFRRVETLADNFPIREISTIKLEGNEIVFDSPDNYQLRIKFSGLDDSLGLTLVILDQEKLPLSYTHYRYDEVLGSLAMIT